MDLEIPKGQGWLAVDEHGTRAGGRLQVYLNALRRFSPSEHGTFKAKQYTQFQESY